EPAHREVAAVLAAADHVADVGEADDAQLGDHLRAADRRALLRSLSSRLDRVLDGNICQQPLADGAGRLGAVARSSSRACRVGILEVFQNESPLFIAQLATSHRAPPSVLVAEAGVEPASRGYGPREFPFLFPALAFAPHGASSLRPDPTRTSRRGPPQRSQSRTVSRRAT